MGVSSFYVIRDVDFLSNEKVYVKGVNWTRLLGSKAHYHSLHLKDGDWIVFLSNCKPGKIYGGTIDRKSSKIESKKEDLITKLNHVFNKIIQDVNLLKDLEGDDLKSYSGGLEKALETFKGYYKNINDYEVLKENFSDLQAEIDLICTKIEALQGKNNLDLVLSKEIKIMGEKNLNIYKSVVKEIINNRKKIDLDKNFDSKDNDLLNKIIVVAMYMDSKGEIYNKDGKDIVKEICEKGRWKIAQRKAKEKVREKEKDKEKDKV